MRRGEGRNLPIAESHATDFSSNGPRRPNCKACFGKPRQGSLFSFSSRLLLAFCVRHLEETCLCHLLVA